MNSPLLRDVLLYVNAHEPSGAAVPGILYSVSNVYLAWRKSEIRMHRLIRSTVLIFMGDALMHTELLE